MRKLMLIESVMVLSLLTTGIHAADFTLTGSRHLDVISIYNLGNLRDYSTADILPGGEVKQLITYNNSTAIVSGGYVGEFHANNSSSVILNDGQIGGFSTAAGNSSLTVSGGNAFSIDAGENSRVSVTNGYVNDLLTSGTSTINVSGGSIGMLLTIESGKVTISGGYIYNLFHGGYETMYISGGIIEAFGAYGPSTVIYGYDFQLGDGLSWGVDGQSILGTGILSGKRLGQTETWSIGIFERDPSAVILAIPEPATLLLLGLGGLMLRRKK